MAVASSFEAKSRTNHLEGPADVKLKPVQERNVDAKKEKAVPPPRKSSDPANKSPVTSPPVVKAVALSAVKQESPKKVSNGSIPQGVQAAVPESPPAVANTEPASKEEPVRKPEASESNGVGDKIRQFERAAEDATAGKLSRTGSVRGRLNDKINPGSMGSNTSQQNVEKVGADKSQMFSPPVFAKWRREDTSVKNPKSEDKESKPGIKFNKFPQDLPTLGARNFAEREQSAQQASVHVCAEHDPIVKKGYSGGNSGAYFARGTEEMWMVKKKDIEEIEDRVLQSFRRAGAIRDGPVREFPFSGASTLGRTKTGTDVRRQYVRSESLEHQVGVRAQTLKRQSSVACTCGHDRKARSRSGCSAAPETGASRPRSRSHGEEHPSEHVLDKYETLV